MRLIDDLKVISGIFLIITYVAVYGQERRLEMRNDPDVQVQVAGFTLDTDKAVKINAVGAGGEKEIRRITSYQVDPKNMFAYAWIINARSRELVWRMTINNTKDDWWDKWNRTFNENVFLERGEYEIYFSSVKPTYYAIEGGYWDFSKIMDKIFGKDDWWEDHSSGWMVQIDNVDRLLDQTAVLKYQKAVKNSMIVDLTEVGDTFNRSKGFTLLKPATLKVYAIGEGWEDEMYDHAYIMNAETRDRIWEMQYDQTEHAGGAIKNRIVQEAIDLAPGDYMIYYRSDDNHSFDEWNANPPYDPHFWGVSVSGVGEDFDNGIIETYEERLGKLVVRLDKLGDYEEVSEGFKIVRPMKLRIYALGEGRDGKMFDFGWIENAQSGRRIWEMRYRDTEEAGGALKNRLYDRIIHFEPGSYIAYFITDDSHSFEDFNQPEPDDPEAWGLKIYTVGKTDDENYIRKYSPERDKNILVQLIRVRDDEHVRQKFTMQRSANVRIYALGEGDWDEMYDYAWIEDYQTGRTVWRMKYKDTRRAGGASKNRLFDGTLYLKAGSYVAHFKTDDSHAFGSWNQDAPRDKSSWGITIYTYDER